MRRNKKRTQKIRRIRKDHGYLISSSTQHTKNKTGKHIKCRHTRKPDLYFKVSVEHFEQLKLFDDASIQNAIRKGFINTTHGFPLIINPFKSIYRANTLIDNVHSKTLHRLYHYLMSNTCVNEPSLYNRCKSVKRQGWYYRVLKKKQNIYKTFPGFVSEQEERNFLTHSHSPSWFGNKYVAFHLANQMGWGINAYKSTRDIFLLDMMHPRNLQRIETILRSDPKYKRDLNDFQTHLGFRESAFKRMCRYYKIARFNRKWTKLYFYTSLPQNHGDSRYCDVRTDKYLNAPILNHNYYIYVHLFDILPIPSLNGFILEQLHSHLDLNGVYRHEELILSHDAQKTILTRDITNSLDWTNWSFANKHIHIRKNIGFNFVGTLSGFGTMRNTNFSILNFYFENTPKLPSSLQVNPLDASIFVYNVNQCNNINSHIKREQNMQNIFEIVDTLHSNINIIVLFDIKQPSPLLRKLQQLGYVYRTEMVQASENECSILSKTKTSYKTLTYTDSTTNIPYKSTLFHLQQKQIIVTDFKHCQYHTSTDDETIKRNALTKQSTLEYATNYFKFLLQHEPDIIMGNMFLQKDDNEIVEYMKKQGFELLQITPPRKKKPISVEPYFKNIIFIRDTHLNTVKKTGELQCNYSTHVPYYLSLSEE